jgi:hypothetical protein
MTTQHVHCSHPQQTNAPALTARVWLEDVDLFAATCLDIRKQLLHELKRQLQCENERQLAGGRLYVRKDVDEW